MPAKGSKALTPAQKLIIKYRSERGDSADDIAKALGLNRSTVHSTIQRARAGTLSFASSPFSYPAPEICRCAAEIHGTQCVRYSMRGSIYCFAHRYLELGDEAHFAPKTHNKLWRDLE